MGGGTSSGRGGASALGGIPGSVGGASTVVVASPSESQLRSLPRVVVAVWVPMPKSPRERLPAYSDFWPSPGCDGSGHRYFLNNFKYISLSHRKVLGVLVFSTVRPFGRPNHSAFFKAMTAAGTCENKAQEQRNRNPTRHPRERPARRFNGSVSMASR
jgi:hypothetical protein